MPTRVHPCQGYDPSAGHCARPLPTTCGRPSRIVGRLERASPLLLLNVPNRRGSAARRTQRVDPSTTSPGQGAVSQSSPSPAGLFVAMRAGGAGTVGYISVRGKNKAMPTIAIGAAQPDRVGDVLDAPPSRSYSSTPPTSSHRRSRPSVLWDAPSCQRACIPVMGVTRGWAAARAVVPTTRGRTGRVRRRPARASPLPLLNGGDRGGSAAPSTHPCEPSSQLRGGALSTNQRPPQRSVLLVCVPAGSVLSARSRVGGRGRRRRCPPATAADPTAAAPSVTTRRHSRRC